CGNQTTDFTRIVKLSTDLIFDNLGNNRGDAFAQCKLRSCLHEWDVLGAGGWPLLHAMPMTETLECTEFEDRVYALLGLATEADRNFVQVDYSRPWEEIQTALGSDTVRFSADLKTLALKGIVVDEVQSAHPAPLQGDEAAWKSTCDEWKEIALEKMKAYASPKDRFEAFCKTLCRGDYRDCDGVLRATCGEAYQTWISGQVWHGKGKYWNAKANRRDLE
ncbi:hypothetical protein SLS54_008868, partial [Diplodia seriata]